MGRAARAIIIENNKILVMQRNKQGPLYYTLVGGRVNDGEELEQTLIREVKEETGLDVISAQQVFYEIHPSPYNEQYIYLCKIALHDQVAIQETSEEAALNRVGVNIHTPLWVDIKAFENLPFRTPQLQAAIVKAFKKGFPTSPERL